MGALDGQSKPMTKQYTCTCGRPYTDDTFKRASLGFTRIPSGADPLAEPAYWLEYSNPCPCGSTVARERSYPPARCRKAEQKLVDKP